jgi:hypothetical protein
VLEVIMTTPTQNPNLRKTGSLKASSARRFGFVISVFVNAAFLYLLNISPGWESIPFLTADTELVIGWVNLSLVLGAVLNAIYVLASPPWFRRLGETVTAMVGFIVAIRLYAVFPFDFTGSGFDWTALVRIILIFGIVGTAIGVVAGIIRFVAAVGRSGSNRSATQEATE